MKKAQYSLLYLIATILGLALPLSCSSDETKGGGSAGTTATGDSGGISEDSGTGGDGGEAGEDGGEAGEDGTPQNGWKKGVVGKAKDVITISSNAGRIQGISVNMFASMMLKDHTMNDPIDGGYDSGETPPNTAPTVNFSGITPDFTEMLIPVPPYSYDWPEEKMIAPKVAIVNKTGEMTILQPFPIWPSTDFALNCFGAYNTNIYADGVELRAYGGLGFDSTTCMNRYFLISNLSNKVWEVYPNGDLKVLVESLPGPSSIKCHQGELLISTLPQYEDDFVAGGVKPVMGVKLHRINIDTGELTTIVTIDPTADYADTSTIAMCGTYPGTTNKYIPIGVNIPFAVRADNSLLIADPAARRIYTCDNNGSNVQEFAPMEQFTVSTIMAPNDIIYSVEPPIADWWSLTKIIRGAVIKAYDGNKWTIVQELTGYNSYAGSMSNQYVRVNCPGGVDDSAGCSQPTGAFIKIVPGAQPLLYIVDPIKGELSAIPLDMDEVDSGAGGSSGSSGAGGKGGDSESTDAGDSAENSE